MPVSFLRGDSICFWCPACDDMKVIPVEGDKKWGWNKDLEKPTLTPSILQRAGPFPDGHTDVCHSHVTAGKINYCGDSTHAMAGKNRPAFPSS